MSGSEDSDSIIITELSRKKPNEMKSSKRTKSKSAPLKTVNNSPSSSRGGRSPSPMVPEGQYEVEIVCDYQKDETGEMYWIKWRNWEEEFNTWEPPTNLVNCEDALLAFYLKRKAQVDEIMSKSEYVIMSNGKRRRRGPPIKVQVPPDPRPFEVRVQEFFDATRPVCEEEIEETYLLSLKKKKDIRWPMPKINKYLQDGVDGKLSEDSVTALREQLMFHELDRRKDNVQTELKAWENRMNAISQGKPHIEVENEVDLAGCPTDFEYINDYITGPGVSIPDDPQLGCNCVGDCYENRKSCCATNHNFDFPYTKHRKIKHHVGYPIYECNRKCSCGPECPNRVVQDGRSNRVDYKLCIFRTANGCGWGVRTPKSIKKGSFVTLYVGEVINTEEAERRGREYDEEGMTYLFDLDFNMDEAPYTVDAAKYGNIAHFINHSCNPNLGVFNVWVNCLDPNLPKLALFALRDIAKNEEITFDYKNQISGESRATTIGNNNVGSGDELPTPVRRKPCLCGESNCRGQIF